MEAVLALQPRSIGIGFDSSTCMSSNTSVAVTLLMNYAENTRPKWSRLIQMLHEGDHLGMSSAVFLSRIDMNFLIHTLFSQ